MTSPTGLRASRRRALLLALAMAAGSGTAFAQNNSSPMGPVRLVVGYSAGGPVDAAARLVAPILQRELGVPVLVDNRPGASGSLGGDAVARAAPDGNTLFFAGSPTIVINPNVQRRMAFDPMKDLQPVASLVQTTNVLVVGKDRPWRSMNELLAFARQHPGELTYGSAGTGGTNHLSAALLEKMSGTQFTHVPYKGNAPAMTDLIGGQIAMMFDVVAGARPFIASGKVRPLAVTSRDRNPMLPDVPTLIESGVSGYEVQGWMGLYAPAATPKAMVTRLNLAVRKALADEALRARLVEQGYEIWDIGPELLAEKARKERAMWATVSKGIETD
ncbi:tripartite tricarboxylate transporter substrate binding protein [Variovorax sp. OV329]|uniref:Bug family tripartite tricarboxylate transporter substrate binding protein n=1 Tax=Variovorax sp. OV329 TaxID=1882825 RepID=UPI0008EEA4F5|nr:tripartite tricarboxylate transporter substrate binding protein [Variovorax sp. OV329]SFM18182.1 Tripartite-type tricarboxylate transporter, receptor component TctC [Variovorax sp. OV329]